LSELSVGAAGLAAMVEGPPYLSTNTAPPPRHWHTPTSQLLDDGRYMEPVRTMYRLLEGCAAVCKRRDQLRHSEYAMPELLAAVFNQVWS